MNRDSSPAGLDEREDLRASHQFLWNTREARGGVANNGAFNLVTRIADATGIPLGSMIRELGAEVRSDLDLGRFSSSAKTPGA